MVYTVENDRSCEAFFMSYVAAALWSTIGDDGETLDDGRDVSDIADETLNTMRADCERFYSENVEAIHCTGAPVAEDVEGISEGEAATAGRDFWLSRCGHEVAFWSGHWPEPYATQLDKASEAFGNVDLYVGDDNKIHAS